MSPTDDGRKWTRPSTLYQVLLFVLSVLHYWARYIHWNFDQADGAYPIQSRGPGDDADDFAGGDNWQFCRNIRFCAGWEWAVSPGANAQQCSEDEIDVLLHGTPRQRKRLELLKNNADKLSSHRDEGNSSSSEDEFEREMNAELNQHITDLENERVFPQQGASLQVSSKMSKSSNGNSQSKQSKSAFYDDVYFDSDEEEDTGSRSQHAIISNDDLLYDPTMDDKDQKWVDRQRREHCRNIKGKSLSGQGKKASKKPSSDALLDCPACLTTVCIDCQRHENYKNQYRAMFVMNCVVDVSEKLQCPEQPSKKKKQKKAQNVEDTASSSSNLSSDLFNPVRCSECNTVIGVIDEDEVYHFFNVIASHT